MTPNRRELLYSLSITAPLALAACQTTESPDRSFDRVSAAAQAMIEEKYTPGLSISVMRNGELLFSGAFGQANIETQTSMHPNSVFKIASITKQMTAAAILLLEQDGRLSTNDPVSKFLPEFPRADEFSIYALATHTAGLGAYNRLPTREIDRLKSYGDSAYLELMLRTDPMFVAEPGEKEAYSNTGYALLGLIISRASGMPYWDFFNTRLFNEAALSRTQFDDPLAVIEDRVSGYSPNPDEASGFERAIYTHPTFPGPGGGVVSTADDLCRWHNALLFGNLLSNESRSRMLAHVSTQEGLSHYGMGVLTKFTRDPFKDRDVVSHGGRIFGFAADLWSFPEKRVTVATLLNSDGGRVEDFGKRFDGVRDPATQIALGELYS